MNVDTMDVDREVNVVEGGITVIDDAADDSDEIAVKTGVTVRG